MILHRAALLVPLAPAEGSPRAHPPSRAPSPEPPPPCAALLPPARRPGVARGRPLQRAGLTLRNVVVGDSCVREHLAGQRVAVGMQAAGRETEYGVAWTYPLTADHLASLARPYAHADDLEVSLGVDTWHLSGLAADERNTESPAGFGSAADYAGYGFGI